MALIFLGLILAYNPFYSYYLMSHGALGGMSIRAAVGGAFLVFLALRFRTTKSILLTSSPIYSLVTVLLVFYTLGCLVGFARGNSFVFAGLDAYPLLEMFCVYYFIRLYPGIKYDYDAIVKWISIYVLIMCISDWLIYSYLTFIKKIGFGALRAYINGVTVNRLMDFMVPIFGSGLIVLSWQTGSRFLRWVLPVCIIFTVALTFYRTVYVAFVCGVLFLMVFRKKNSIVILKTVLISVVIGFFALTIFKPGHGGDPAGLLTLVKQRMQSTFDSRREDHAINSRFNQTYRAIKEIPNVLLVGYGVGGYLDESPIQITSNYFLQTFLILGFFGGLLFAWLYAKIVAVLIRLSMNIEGQKERLFYLALASVMVSLGVVLCFFPYTIYFPLLYLFGAIAAIADRGDMDHKARLKAGGERCLQ